VDVNGARALADRIASGKPESPPEEATPEIEATEEPPEAPPAERVEIVYVEPKPTPKRDVRIYVRGRDGRLERFER